MTLLVPTVGENACLSDLLGKTSPGTLTLKLYVNDIVPADGDTASTYTEFGAVQGYTSKSLVPANWTIAQSGGKAEATYAQQTWSFTGGTPVTVYGYFVVDAGGVLRWAERFSASKVVQFNGDQILITPKFTLSKE